MVTTHLDDNFEMETKKMVRLSLKHHPTSFDLGEVLLVPGCERHCTEDSQPSIHHGILLTACLQKINSSPFSAFPSHTSNI
jgi:hypothetical protein